MTIAIFGQDIRDLNWICSFSSNYNSCSELVERIWEIYAAYLDLLFFLTATFASQMNIVFFNEQSKGLEKLKLRRPDAIILYSEKYLR